MIILKHFAGRFAPGCYTACCLWSTSWGSAGLHFVASCNLVVHSLVLKNGLSEGIVIPWIWSVFVFTPYKLATVQIIHDSCNVIFSHYPSLIFGCVIPDLPRFWNSSLDNLRCSGSILHFVIYLKRANFIGTIFLIFDFWGLGRDYIVSRHGSFDSYPTSLVTLQGMTFPF